MVELNQGQTEGCVGIPEEEPAIESAGACITYAGWNSICTFQNDELLKRTEGPCDERRREY